MAVEEAGRRKERQVFAVAALDLGAAAVARADRGVLQAVGDGDRRFMEKGARRLGEGDLALAPPGGDPFDLADDGEVGVGRGRRVIGLIDAKERP